MNRILEPPFVSLQNSKNALFGQRLTIVGEELADFLHRHLRARRPVGYDSTVAVGLGVASVFCHTNTIDETVYLVN